MQVLTYVDKDGGVFYGGIFYGGGSGVSAGGSVDALERGQVEVVDVDVEGAVKRGGDEDREVGDEGDGDEEEGGQHRENLQRMTKLSRMSRRRYDEDDRSKREQKLLKC